MKYFVHSVPGRLRVKIPMIKYQPAKKDEINRILALDGIDCVKINSTTGSIVVAYDSEKLDSETILDMLAHHNLFDADKALLPDQRADIVVNKVGQKIGRAFFGWAVGKALEANGLSLLAAFI